MWRATLKGITAHKMRLLRTAVAIVLGVGFVAGTYILTDTMNAAFDSLFTQINKGTAVEVTSIPQFKASTAGQDSGTPNRVPASLVETVQAVPGVNVAEGTIGGYAQLVDKKGDAVTTGGAPTLGTSWTSDPEMNALTLRQGRAPTTSSEIAIDAGTASKHDFTLGQRVKVLLQGPPMEATIVGIVGFGSTDNLGGATLVVFDTATAQKAFDAPDQFDAIQVAADQGVTPEDLRDRIQNVLPSQYQAKTGAESAAQQSDDVKKALGFFTIALLVFADIALFVGAFTIYNTFSILVAQRTRELALLRALGASRAQVRRAVLGEAVIVGLVASVLGLAFGFVVAIGLQALLNAFGIDLPSTSLQILPRTIIVSILIGLGTTVVSSLVPAARASKVPPIAALRDPVASVSTFSTRRTIIGIVVTLGGAAALLLGLVGNTSNGGLLVGLGAGLVFLGVAVLSPLFARPVARAIGAPLARFLGISGRLGRENAMRNPKRTASTAAALMIGLGLIGFVSIFAASVKTSANDALEQTLKADYIVTSTSFQPFSQDVATQLSANSAFDAVSQVRIGIMGYKGAATQVSGMDPATITQVAQVQMTSGSVSALAQNDALLVWQQTAESNGWKVGDTIPVEFNRTGKQNLKLVGVYKDNRLLGNWVVSLDTYDRNFTQQLDTFVLATRSPGTTQSQASTAAKQITDAFPNVQLQDQAQFRQAQASQIDQLLGLISALLALAILIALFGIANTLALSVYERTREIGLLRAVGMARLQVKRMIRWEAVIIAVFGALLGVVVGIFFGWAMVQALKDQGITALTIPGGQLLIYVLIAAVAGVVAAIAPARRAAKLNVLEAITTE
jgi:putative ABC transport system permease protein